MRDILFFRSSAPVSLAVIAELGRAALPDDADPSRRFTMAASLDLATALDVSVLGVDEPADALETTNAGACFVLPCHRASVPERTIALVTDDPSGGFERAATLLCPESAKPTPVFARNGIEPTAVIHSTAKLELGITIDPGVVIGARVEIGTGTTIGANTTIGSGVRIGRGCAIDCHVSIAYALIGDNVVIHAGARLGQGAPSLDGVEGARPTHLGRVIVQNDAEIGANVVIGRGRLGDTIIGDGSRIASNARIDHDAKIDRLTFVETAPASVSSIRKMP